MINENEKGGWPSTKGTSWLVKAFSNTGRLIKDTTICFFTVASALSYCFIDIPHRSHHQQDIDKSEKSVVYNYSHMVKMT